MSTFQVVNLLLLYFFKQKHVRYCIGIVIFYCNYYVEIKWMIHLHIPLFRFLNLRTFESYFWKLIQNSVKINCVYILLTLKIYVSHKGVKKRRIDPDFTEWVFHTCVKDARACNDIDIAAAGMNDIKFNTANLSGRTPQRVDMPHTLALFTYVRKRMLRFNSYLPLYGDEVL